MRIRRSFNNLRLRNRLILSFLAVMIPATLILGTVSIAVSTRIVTDLVTESSQIMLDRATQEIDIFLNTVLDTALPLRDDPFIQRSLRTRFIDRRDQHALDLEAASELSFIREYRDEIFGLYVIGENGSQFKSSILSFRSDILRTEDWYRQVITADDAVWLEPTLGSLAVKTTGNQLMSYGLPIVDKSTGFRNGIVLIEFEIESLLEILDSRVERSAGLAIEYSGGIIGRSNQDPFAGDSPTNGNRFGNLGGPRNLVLSSPLGIPGWRLSAILNIRDFSSENRIIIFAVLILLAIITGFSLTIMWMISGGIVAPIQDIVSQMKLAQDGDLSVSVIVDHDNEIGDLSKNFNRMIRRINELMVSQNEQHVQLRKSQLEALQAQINPHFLYNTLESIIWLSREKKNIDIIRMVEALTSLFRIGISRGGDIIPIEREIEHVRSYLVIQHMRYRNKFSYSFSVSEDIKQYLCLKLILQPIVENAIYHGIKLVREKGHVEIVGYKEGEKIIFEVRDTGPGMTASFAEDLRRTIKGERVDGVASYGLRNVQERIEIFFGDTYGLDFSPRAGGGTIVRIEIPVVREAEEYAQSITG